MKTIPLTKGYVALVDDADYERLISAGPWHSAVDTHNVYAAHTIRRPDGNQTLLWLHRFIMGVTDREVQVDHDDHNGLNCQRYNLRPCTRAQNTGNQRKYKTVCTSKFKGVCWNKRHKKWHARLQPSGKTIYLGSFTSELDAALSYDAAAREYFGQFALCNFPLQQPDTQLPIAA